jgi:nitronate monooxygenase
MDRIETDFTRMMGIEYPIIGAPMFLVSYEELTVAVSEAGGLGMFPTPNYRTVEDLERALVAIRKATSKPIGVNLHLHGRFPWREQLALCLDAGVSFFITSLGDPRLVLDDVHANGGKVFPDVISLEQALKSRDRGADGLIAVGAGAGGHGGTVSTMVLVPYLREEVGLPVIAAGGISTGRQMAAALALGACGVIVGTRLIATPEARAKEEYKRAVIEAGPEEIVYTDRITGNPCNWLARSIERVERAPELGSKRWLDFWSAGQSVAQVREIKPARAVVGEMVREYLETLRELDRTVAWDAAC